ncbi:MAG: hypothetical protein ACK5Q5_06425, partial [Planctomycetaceae bacterium]
MTTLFSSSNAVELTRAILPFGGAPQGSTDASQQIRWPAKWLKPKLSDIEALQSLAPDWDSYGA